MPLSLKLDTDTKGIGYMLPTTFGIGLQTEHKEAKYHIHTANKNLPKYLHNFQKLQLKTNCYKC
jgi:hypothetical protein